MEDDDVPMLDNAEESDYEVEGQEDALEAANAAEEEEEQQQGLH
jgi:hypothetical protein